MGWNFGSYLAASSCCSQIFLADAKPVFDLGQALLKSLGVVAQEQDAEGRITIDKHAAFAVEQGAARRDDRDVADLVAFREVGKMARLHDLQLPETDQQKNDEDDRHVGKKCQPTLRDLLVVNVPGCQLRTPAQRQGKRRESRCALLSESLQDWKG